MIKKPQDSPTNIITVKMILNLPGVGLAYVKVVVIRIIISQSSCVVVGARSEDEWGTVARKHFDRT